MKWFVFLFFIVFLIVPLLSILIVSFTGEPVNIFGSLISISTFKETLGQIANFSLESIKNFFTSSRYLTSLLNSLTLSLGVALFTTLICLPMAYAFAKTEMKFKKTLSALATIPLIMPTFIASQAFVLMFGKTGWITQIWNNWTGKELLFDIHSVFGIVLVQILFFFPYALWPMVAAFKVSDVTLEEAAQNMGSKTWYTFISVSFPLAIPGILSSMLLVFTVSFSDFGTPIILAPKKLNLIVVEAYREMAGFYNWSGSAVLTLVMIIVAALFFWLQRYITKRKQYGTISGKPSRQKLIKSNFLNRVLFIFTASILLIPTLALGSLILSSFATTWGHHPLPNGYTFDNYVSVFSSSSNNIFNSLLLAGGTLILSVIIAIFVSYFVVRRGSATLDIASSLPLVIPGIGLGIALIQTFNTAPFALTGTALILIIGYTIRRMPYMIRSTIGTMQAIRKDIEEAAVNMGASTMVSAITIVGPLLLPGIAAGSILVFVTVIKETSLSILLASGKWAPMSLTIFQNINKGEYYTASAMALIMIVIVIVLQLVANKLSKNQNE